MIALFGFRTTGICALIGGFCGITSLITLKIIKHDQIETMFIAMIVSALAFFASHFILRQPGGLSKIKKQGLAINIEPTIKIK